LYANEFHTSNDDVIFPDGEISLSMDIAYANQIIDGVLSHLEEIDTILEPYCTKRKFVLMDKVDRAILRLAIWELNYNSEDVSPSIVINEAVQLAKSFGSDASYKLINAILDAYNKSK
ncbi:transcription antitermination factor NusB, partial [Veillonella atypica]